MKKLSVLVLLIAAIIGGVKGIIYYKVTTQLDHAIELLSSSFLMSYEGVSSSLQGSITVSYTHLTLPTICSV